MATNLPVPRASHPPATTSSLVQRSSNARSILAQATTPVQAAKAAKALTGQFPNLRADNPAAFNDSIAAVFSQYPAQVVHDALDPRSGIARAVDWLTLKGLSDWCDRKLELYQALAGYQPPEPAPPPPEPGPISAETIERVLAEVRDSRTPSPLDVMLEKRARMRRLRIEEVMRRAEEPPAAAGAAQ